MAEQTLSSFGDNNMATVVANVKPSKFKVHMPKINTMNATFSCRDSVA